MTDLRTAAQQALERLMLHHRTWDARDDLNAITALRAALEQPEQEPVAWIQSNHLQLAQRGPFSCRVEPTQRHPDFVPLYTHPPRREWRSLSEEEIKNAVGASAEFWATSALWIKSVARAVEAALRSKNYE